MTNFGPGFPVGVAAVVPQADPLSGGVAEIPVNDAAGKASATVTLSGTAASGDTVTVTIANHPVTFTLGSSDTLTTAAAGLATDINNDATDKLVVSAAASGPVLTVTALNEGQAGLLSLAASATGITATASGTRLDFADQIVIPNQTFAYAAEQGVQTFYAGQPVSVSASLKSQLQTQGLIF